ncbi:MAG TPA: hypothetical protein VFP33_00190 [Gallionella sp.]|nr:hypothetical protein [Gallionella sp.]
MNRRTVLFAFYGMFFMQSATAGFFGPTVEILPADQVWKRMQEQPLAFTTNAAPLEIRTKGAAIGGFLIGSLLSSAAMSGGGAGVSNPAQMQQQMQANMAVAQQLNPQIQGLARDVAAKSEARSAQDIAKQGPLPLIAPNLMKVIQERKANLVADASDGPSLKLRLSQNTWKLEFAALSSDYTLNSALHLELRDTKADKVYFQRDCGGEYGKKMPLEDWERDQSKAIAEAAQEVAQNCQVEFLRELGIASDDVSVTRDVQATAATAIAVSTTPDSVAPIPEKKVGQVQKME